MKLRELLEDDLDTICRHREAMFREAGHSEGVLSVMTSHFRKWLAPRLHDGSYFGFMICEATRPIAGIGLMLIDWPPHPWHPNTDKRGYVLNVYVEPPYRRRGLAAQLMALADTAFAKRRVTFAVLHASHLGRPLYESLGWKETAEMSKVPNPE
jgi:ribosomal protein S18 acetylase RimI-like enzyme